MHLDYTATETIENAPFEELSEGLRTLARLIEGTEMWYAPCGAGRKSREYPSPRCPHGPCQNLMTWVCFSERHSFCLGGLAGSPILGCRCICHLPGHGNERRDNSG